MILPPPPYTHTQTTQRHEIEIERRFISELTTIGIMHATLNGPPKILTGQPVT